MKDKNIKKHPSFQALIADLLENISGGQCKVFTIPGMGSTGSDAVNLSAAQTQWLLQNNYDLSVMYSDAPRPNPYRCAGLAEVSHNGRSMSSFEVKRLLESNNIT